jgi:hypothetical protein
MARNMYSHDLAPRALRQLISPTAKIFFLISIIGDAA